LKCYAILVAGGASEKGRNLTILKCGSMIGKDTTGDGTHYQRYPDVVLFPMDSSMPPWSVEIRWHAPWSVEIR
jgi:hypothetical protein